MKLTIIDKNWRLIDENCLNTHLLFLIIFVAIADGVFLYKKSSVCKLFSFSKHVFVNDLQSLRNLFVAQPHLYDSLAAVGAAIEGECFLQ